MTSVVPFRFVPGDTPLHGLDPRTKLGATVLLTVLVFAVSTPPACVLVALGIGFLTVFSKMGLATLLRAFRSFLWLAVLFFVLVLFTTAGHELFRLYFLVATREGLAQAVLQTFRLFAFIALWNVLAWTSSPVALTDGLEKLTGPLARIGVPVRETGIVLMIAFRFVPVLLEETDRIIEAQSARGADLRYGSPVRRVRNLVPIFVPLFVKALRRAEELAAALESRGFRDGERTARLHPLAPGPRDLAATLIAAAFCAATFGLDLLY